jgi:hypothetical protein
MLINPYLQTDFDDLSDILNSLCLGRGGQKTKPKSAQIKSTICKVSASVNFGSGKPFEDPTKPSESSAAAAPTDRTSSPDNAKQKRFPRPNPLKKFRVVVCTWGARCNRPTCTFFHASPAGNFVLPESALMPKLCRFGALCQKAACVFCHPSPAAGL